MSEPSVGETHGSADHANNNPDSSAQRDLLPGVKHVVVVLSGKGGVGKSTVATQLALWLRCHSKKVGLLDIDLCGPSIPRMLNLEGSDVHQSPEGWVPVFADKEQKLAVMSTGFLLSNKSEAVIWRGPKKNAMIKQFLTDVCWSDLDYLIIDTPPGTSDEHISIAEGLRQINPDGAVIVTTPQAVSVGDVRREITFCRKTGIPVLGIIENMSGYRCPHCSDCVNVFSKGGGEALAKEAQVPFLGQIPLDPQLTQCLEMGESFIEKFTDSETAKAVSSIALQIIKE